MPTTSASLPRALGRLRSGLLALTLCVPAVLLTSPPAQAAPGDATMAIYEARVLKAINVQRRAHRLPTVYAWSCVDRYAERWASFLKTRGLLLHARMPAVLSGCSGTRVAENLAVGGVTPEQVVAMWMKSPGHRANLLDARFTEAGVAATRSHGQWTVVLDLLALK